MLLLALLGALPAKADEAAFRGWAVAVIAGDSRAGSGQPTAAFENARRDIAATLLRAGVAPDRLVQFSPTARLRAAVGVLQTDRASFAAAWMPLARDARGCLVYLTSHGTEQGVVFGDGPMLSPVELDMTLDLTCGEKPTVVVVSACYSGVFVPVLAAPNRLVMTAARRDRSSFGCSEDSTHPYFDGCVLKSWPAAPTFPALAAAARSCVAARERAEKLKPPSEPQLFVGDAIRPLAATLSLRP